jgi:cytidylate kinase
MTNKLLITIGREYGSGGREIGERLSKRLGIPLFDKEIITESVKRSGFCQEFFEQYDERPTSSLLYGIAMGSYYPQNMAPLSDQLFLEQFKTISSLAKKGSGIFVGRCADYVLSKEHGLVSVFIHANLEERIGRIMERTGLSREAAEKEIKKTDKRRGSYYERYTGKKWGNMSSYHITISSSRFGVEQTAEFLGDLLERFA